MTMHHFMRDVASHLIAKFGIYVPDLEIGKENAITKILIILCLVRNNVYACKNNLMKSSEM